LAYSVATQEEFRETFLPTPANGLPMAELEH
jgi:hypothetical protein